MARALEGLCAAEVPCARIVVVDDASKDGTAEIALGYGVQVEVLSRNGGPARARNRGAALIKDDVIIFVDGDVIVHPDAIKRLLASIEQNAAVFGSYDAAPIAPGRISRIRNLFHHWTHQCSPGEVASFWTGLGAIRRDVFEDIGGFDEQMDYMEDVDLGMRLSRAGHKVILDPLVLGTHIKSWTLSSMLLTDLWRRAVPWARLITDPANRYVPKALNAGARGRNSVLLVAGSLLGLAGVLITPWAFVGCIACVGFLSEMHRGFLTLLAKEGKRWDRTAAIGVLWLIYLMAGLGYAIVLLENNFRGFVRFLARPGDTHSDQ